MAKRLPISALFASLFKPEIKDTYINADMERLLERREIRAETLAQANDDDFDDKEAYADFVRQLEADVREIDERIDAMKQSLGDAGKEEFLFTKLTLSEIQECEEGMSRATTGAIERMKGDEKARAEEISRYRMVFDPKGVFSSAVLGTDDAGRDLDQGRQEILDMVVDQILSVDGYTKAWVGEIDPDDPEMALTDAEEEMLSVDERDPLDVQVEFAVNREEKRQALLAEKRDRLVQERTQEREKRAGDLREKGFDLLLETFWNYRILTVASREGASHFQDLQLYYSVKEPKAPIYATFRGEKVIDDHERYFASVEEVAFVRGHYEHFYEWLASHYNFLQQVKTKEDVERLARSSLFRHLL